MIIPLDPPSVLSTVPPALPVSVQLTSEAVVPGGRDQEKEMLLDVVMTVSMSTTGFSGAGTSGNIQK